MITSRALPFPLDLPAGRALSLDLREASAMMEAGVPDGKNGVLARATQALNVA